MAIFDNLRPLLRIASALERIAVAYEKYVALAERQWSEDHPMPKSARRGNPPVEFATMDIGEVERRVSQMRAERMEDLDTEA